jgi:hypothetical protein
MKGGNRGGADGQSMTFSSSRVLRSAPKGSNHKINQPRSHTIPIDQHSSPSNKKVQLKDKDKKKKGKKSMN